MNDKHYYSLRFVNKFQWRSFLLVSAPSIIVLLSKFISGYRGWFIPILFVIVIGIAVFVGWITGKSTPQVLTDEGKWKTL
jgi:hypothetical protein